MTCNPLVYSMRAKSILDESLNFADDFVRLKIEFFHLYQNGLVFSTRVGGADFFDTVISYLNSNSELQPEPGAKLSEYDKNFNVWLKQARGIK